MLMTASRDVLGRRRVGGSEGAGRHEWREAAHCRLLWFWWCAVLCQFRYALQCQDAEELRLIDGTMGSEMDET